MHAPARGRRLFRHAEWHATQQTGLLQRIVLLSHNKGSDTVSLRHYCISLTPAGLTKGIKALVTTKAAPDLSQFSSVADFVERAGYASDSDPDEATRVTAPHAERGQASRVRLHEVRTHLALALRTRSCLLLLAGVLNLPVDWSSV